MKPAFMESSFFHLPHRKKRQVKRGGRNVLPCKVCVPPRFSAMRGTKSAIQEAVDRNRLWAGACLPDAVCLANPALPELIIFLTFRLAHFEPLPDATEWWLRQYRCHFSGVCAQGNSRLGLPLFELGDCLFLFSLFSIFCHGVVHQLINQWNHQF